MLCHMHSRSSIASAVDHGRGSAEDPKNLDLPRLRLILQISIYPDLPKLISVVSQAIPRRMKPSWTAEVRATMATMFRGTYGSRPGLLEYKTSPRGKRSLLVHPVVIKSQQVITHQQNWSTEHVEVIMILESILNVYVVINTNCPLPPPSSRPPNRPSGPGGHHAMCKIPMTNPITTRVSVATPTPNTALIHANSRPPGSAVLDRPDDAGLPSSSTPIWFNHSSYGGWRVGSTSKISICKRHDNDGIDEGTPEHV